jgi:predicted amidohydrolase YtcJ
MAARITAYLVAIIVGVTVIAGLIVGAQRDDDGPVDLIVVNGSVYTADGDNTMAEAVAVQGNKILMVGSNREIQRLRRAQTVVVDAKGGAVLPGFNDAVDGFVANGLALEEIDLTDANSIGAIEATIKAWVAANPTREWVVGHGWSVDVFAERAPTRQMLDELVPDRPALFIARDGQTAWANSLALKRARITRRTAAPAGGTIVKDVRSGEPTGVLKQEAIELVSRLLPPATREHRMAALRTAVDDAHRRGITSVQDISASPEDLALYDELRKAGNLDVRVYAALRARLDMTEAELDTFEALREQYADDPVFKTGAITLVTDSEDGEVLRDVVAALDARGWQVIIQAIGERAVRMAMDAVEYASGKNPAPDRGRRHRVEAAANSGDEPGQGVQFATSEKRTLSQAVDAYTREAAWASFDEHRKGSLERDMLADLVILTQDIFAAPTARLADPDVAITIFDGRVVYTRSTDTNE